MSIKSSGRATSRFPGESRNASARRTVGCASKARNWRASAALSRLFWSARLRERDEAVRSSAILSHSSKSSSALPTTLEDSSKEWERMPVRSPSVSPSCLPDEGIEPSTEAGKASAAPASGSSNSSAASALVSLANIRTRSGLLGVCSCFSARCIAFSKFGSWSKDV